MLKALIASAAAGLMLVPAAFADGGKSRDTRFATFNASLNRSAAGQLITDLSTPANQQAKNVAETIQRVRPDVVLINEFDYDANGTALRLFQDNYLSIPQSGAAPIRYRYRFAAESNTGIPSGFDLNNNGAIGGPDDAYGFGFYPGQFGMAVYSRYPIDPTGIRTFQKFLWKDMPGAKLPDDPATTAPRDWYSPAELNVFRLSSKSHWDLPVLIDRKVVHFLTSHPTPPVFDGPEDRNGTRNFDEIRLWADYVTPGRGSYLYDDAGRRGGLRPGSLFVIAGDQNSDPLDGDSIPGAIQQLLENRLVNTRSTPTSPGAVEQNALQGGINLTHKSDPKFDTADFADNAPGNLRADYVLPRKNVRIVGSGVFWPLMSDPLFRLVGVFPFPTSDHRLVWVDVEVPGRHDDRDHEDDEDEHDEDDD
jgi:3-phytase